MCFQNANKEMAQRQVKMRFKSGFKCGFCWVQMRFKNGS